MNFPTYTEVMFCSIQFNSWKKSHSTKQYTSTQILVYCLFDCLRIIIIIIIIIIISRGGGGEEVSATTVSFHTFSNLSLSTTRSFTDSPLHNLCLMPSLTKTNAISYRYTEFCVRQPMIHTFRLDLVVSANWYFEQQWAKGLQNTWTSLACAGLHNSSSDIDRSGHS